VSSNEQLNDEPDSEELNPKVVGVRLGFTGPVGPALIVVSGGIATVNALVAGFAEPLLPAASMA
jgi:hypothetical protein